MRIPVTLQVWDFTLPDHLSFLPEMNCYGLPENERDYYRLAHRHRTVLNRLPYNQNGHMQEGCAPRWDSSRQTLDWSAWDRRFGPLLDGSAFADLPRPRVPVECFYLPLHENWPSSMEGYYNGDYWADRAFPESYRRAFVAAAREIATHVPGQRLDGDPFSGLSQQQEQFQGSGLVTWIVSMAFGRAGQLPGLLGSALLRAAFHEGINQAKRDGAGSRASAAPAHSLASSTSGSLAPVRLPSRHLASAVAARQPRWPARLPCRRQRDAKLSGSRHRAKACLRRDRAGIWLNQPRRGLEPPAGGMVP